MENVVAETRNDEAQRLSVMLSTDAVRIRIPRVLTEGQSFAIASDLHDLFEKIGQGRSGKAQRLQLVRTEGAVFFILQPAFLVTANF